MRCLKYYFTLLSMILISSLSLAQANLLMTNSKPINEKRYAGIKGSPYLFKSHVRGEIINHKGEVYQDILLNYNGDIKNIEAFKDDRMITLESNIYPRIIIRDHKLKKSVDGTLELVNHPYFRGDYVMEIFRSGLTAVYRKFSVSLISVETNIPGETITKDRFKPKNEYYLILNGEYSKVNRKDKDFINALGNENALRGFLKKSKNKLKTDQDIRELMEFYVSLQ